MEIVQHRLHKDDGKPAKFVESPNRGGALNPEFLVMHYTAGGSVAGAIGTLTDPAAKASAHLVIARNGAITQLVPFDRVAYHAGHSRWHGLSGLNKYSLGIELVNAGPLNRQGKRWRAWFGKHYDDKDVVEAVHQDETVPHGWHAYTPAQVNTAIEVSCILANYYGLRDVVGHDDIAPGRKRDPGPAFPMDHFRGRVLGRRDDVPETFETTTQLNVRKGPGTQFEKLSMSPLPPGARLENQRREVSWCFVNVLDDDGNATATGWVHGDFIRPAA